MYMAFKELPRNPNRKVETAEPLSSLQMSPQVRAAVADKLFDVLAKLADEKQRFPTWEDVYTNIRDNLKSAKEGTFKEYSDVTFCDAAEALISLKLLTRKQLDGMIAESRREVGE